MYRMKRESRLGNRLLPAANIFRLHGRRLETNIPLDLSAMLHPHGCRKPREIDRCSFPDKSRSLAHIETLSDPYFERSADRSNRTCNARVCRNQQRFPEKTCDREFFEGSDL